MLLSVTCADLARADEPAAPKHTKEQEEEARLHFAAGVNLVRDPARPRYEEAYAEFNKAYELTSSPKILGNIGLCAMKLERDSEAIDAYERFLAQVPEMPAEERLQIENDLATLKTTVARITIESKPPGAMLRDVRSPNTGDEVTNTYGPLKAATLLGLRRGHHTLRARWPDGSEAVWVADLNGGESHTFEPPVVTAPPPTAPAPAPVLAEVPREQTGPRPIPTSVYIAGGATLALGLGSLVTGIVALDRKSDFDAQNDGRSPARADDLRSAGTTLNVVTDVLLVSALIGAGVTAYLFVTRPTLTAKAAGGGHFASSPLRLQF